MFECVPQKFRVSIVFGFAFNQKAQVRVDLMNPEACGMVGAVQQFGKLNCNCESFGRVFIQIFATVAIAFTGTAVLFPSVERS
jgi:hypothetical protein